MSPPRTVDELLQEVASSASGPEALLDADDAIRAHYWASRFREDFLEKRKMHGKVAALRFLVLTMPFDEGIHPLSAVPILTTTPYHWYGMVYHTIQILLYHY